MLFLGRAFEAGEPFLMWKIPIFRLLLEVFLCFFWPACCSALPLLLHFPPPLLLAGWLVAVFLASTASGAGTNPPPVASTKKLLANAGTSLGMELSLTCSCILLKKLDANFATVETYLVSMMLLVLIKFCENKARSSKTDGFST